jgi:hypothetical protein
MARCAQARLRLAFSSRAELLTSTMQRLAEQCGCLRGIAVVAS